MKKQISEYLKLVHSLGLNAGTQAGFKKNLASGDFELQVPGQKQKILVRKNSSDWNVFKQVFVWKEYEYPISFKPATILDAGANVGYAALWFHARFPGAEIISLEPETSNFEALKRNTEGHEKIKPLKAGLWSRPCYLRITHTGWGTWGFRTEEVANEGPDTIRAVNIRQLMEENGWDVIDILKMDIEGAESKVFDEGVDEWLPKVKLIFLELHDNVNRQCSKAVFKALLKYDFSVDISGENLILINNSYQ